MHAVLKPGVERPFAPTAFVGSLLGSGGKPSALDKDEDNENSSHTFLESVQPTKTPNLLRSLRSGKRKDKVQSLSTGICLSKYKGINKVFEQLKSHNSIKKFQKINHKCVRQKSLASSWLTLES